MKVELWLLGVVGCSEQAALYGEADWHPQDRVGEIVVRQERAGEASIGASFWSDDGPALELLPELGSCEDVGVPPYRGWSVADVGSLELVAESEALPMTFDGSRYRLALLEPLTIGPQVRFSAHAEGGVLAGFDLNPAFMMPAAELAITEPPVGAGPVPWHESFTLRWTGHDRYARMVVRVGDAWGSVVTCVLPDDGSAALALDEEPWLGLNRERGLHVSLERRRTRYADVDEGPLMLRTSYVQTFDVEPTKR